jgi:CheY-specific phosphatase CheX
VRVEETKIFTEEINRSVEEVFESLLGSRAYGLPTQFAQTAALLQGYCAILKVQSEGLECEIRLAFPQDTIQKVVAEVYGAEMAMTPSSLKHGVGELTNIIYTLAKGRLNNQGFRLKPTIPEVREGCPFNRAVQDSGVDILIPVHSPQGDFDVFIGFHDLAA